MTIAAAVAVVPFSTALIRLILLLKYRPTVTELEQIRSLIRRYPQGIIFGPAIYTFAGHVRLILMTAVKADHILILTNDRNDTCEHGLQDWLKKNGLETDVTETHEVARFTALLTERTEHQGNQNKSLSEEQLEQTVEVEREIAAYLLTLML